MGENVGCFIRTDSIDGAVVLDSGHGCEHVRWLTSEMLVPEVCAVLGVYTTLIGSLLQIFWDILSTIFRGQRIQEECM